jgi:hypothetical protein
MLKQLHTAHNGHLQIGEHKIEGLPRKEFDRNRPVRSDSDIILLAQQEATEVADHVIIFNHKQLRPCATQRRISEWIDHIHTPCITPARRGAMNGSISFNEFFAILSDCGCKKATTH